MQNFARRHVFLPLYLMAVIALGACSTEGVKKEAKYPSGHDRDATEDIYEDNPSVFGSNGLKLFGGRGDDKDKYSGQSGIGVNSYLWRASLDTVSFMPLASADPFGGVILTDWYAPPETPDERFKLNVFILDRQLRSDGIQVKVFRQIKRGGNWQDSTVSGETARQLEDTILTRARQMRVAQMSEQ